jgi:hypothetical protein
LCGVTAVRLHAWAACRLQPSSESPTPSADCLVPLERESTRPCRARTQSPLFSFNPTASWISGDAVSQIPR